jgi:hypothetical protein
MLLSTKQMKSIFGEPNKTGEGYLVTINLPYPMRLAWNLKQTVQIMRCHKLVADRFEKVFKELLAHYGLKRLQELGIDIFGGCFMYRLMRNGSELSRHSWAAAIDLDPLKNGLRSNRANSTFDNPEYDEMRAIFKRNGFASMGEEKGFDWMHFEAFK